MGPVFEKKSLDGLEEVVVDDGALQIVVGGQVDTNVRGKAIQLINNVFKEKGNRQFPLRSVVIFEELAN